MEILRRLIHGARILILDEPTDVLTPLEARDLYRVLGELAEEGRTVLFISHRLPEVLGASRRVTVMRHGRKVGTVETAGTSERELASLLTAPGLSVRRETRTEIGWLLGLAALAALAAVYVNRWGK